MNHTYSILFYLKKEARSTNNKVSIILRITVDGKRAEQSTKRSIEPDRWDSKAGRVKGNKADARAINDHLDTIHLKINKIHSKLEEAEALSLLKRSKTSSMELMKREKPSWRFSTITTIWSKSKLEKTLL
ncbi:MAG: Arm DNA-binding domain-containing protein [Bacteroidota bacterium]